MSTCAKHDIDVWRAGRDTVLDPRQNPEGTPLNIITGKRLVNLDLSQDRLFFSTIKIYTVWLTTPRKIMVFTTRRSSSSKRTSSVRRTRAKSTTYKTMKKQLGVSPFVVMSQGSADHLTVPQGGNVSPTTHMCPLLALLNSQMGYQLMTMYDEFRIVNFKVKVSPQIGAA